MERPEHLDVADELYGSVAGEFAHYAKELEARIADLQGVVATNLALTRSQIGLDERVDELEARIKKAKEFVDDLGRTPLKRDLSRILRGEGT